MQLKKCSKAFCDVGGHWIGFAHRKNEIKNAFDGNEVWMIQRRIGSRQLACIGDALYQVNIVNELYEN